MRKCVHFDFVAEDEENKKQSLHPLFFSFVCSIQWETLIERSKYPLSEGDLLFSKRLESVRKDVECFFGILKIPSES